ncbi:glutamate racemase [bacterium]|nr:glutamate racemase [bacterium]
MNNKPIGIFDSGVGGLSVFSELTNLLPDENYIYFGDTANLPYGSKTKEELIHISKNIFDFFQHKSVKAVVMACNTTSAIVYDELKNDYDFKIYPVVQNVSAQIANDGYKNIGVFATNATINSHAYKKEIQNYNKEINVYEIACPEWVSIVENSQIYELSSIGNIKLYIDKMLKNNPDKIILGCTHYPYLLDILSKFVPKNMFINPAIYLAQYIYEDLAYSNLLNTQKHAETKFYVSSNPEQFKKAAQIFYNVDKVEEMFLSKLCV